MNKGELLRKMAEAAGITPGQAEKALDAFRIETMNQLSKGGRVTLVGFGTFLTAARKPRAGRNPATGEQIKIASRRVPKFRPGAELKAAVSRK